jgi:hypothetical protein
MVLGQKTSRPRLDEEVEDEDNDRGSYTPDLVLHVALNPNFLL